MGGLTCEVKGFYFQIISRLFCYQKNEVGFSIHVWGSETGVVPEGGQRGLQPLRRGTLAPLLGKN